VNQPQLIRREAVYEGKMITVYRDTLRNADGREMLREVVIHPDSVAIVAVDDEDMVVLVRQYRHPVGAELLELPAGLMDEPGESPLQVAQRELAEETGLSADAWLVLVQQHPTPGMSNEQVCIYLAQGLHPAAGEHERDADEDLDVMRMPFTTALQEIREGRITNGLAVAGLLALADMRA
jgi:8-oxo-dGDP phosphatase